MEDKNGFSNLMTEVEWTEGKILEADIGRTELPRFERISIDANSPVSRRLSAQPETGIGATLHIPTNIDPQFAPPNPFDDAERWRTQIQEEKEKLTPKSEVGSKKVNWSALPFDVLAEVSLAMVEGAVKYGRHDYRVMKCPHSDYFDATMRHQTAWFEGQDIDPDSGRHHIDKAIASLIVLRASMLAGTDIDDRPPSKGINYEKLNVDTAKLHEHEPIAPVYTAVMVRTINEDQPDG